MIYRVRIDMFTKKFVLRAINELAKRSKSATLAAQEPPGVGFPRWQKGGVEDA
jgi:hypothetical protein